MHTSETRIYRMNIRFLLSTKWFNVCRINCNLSSLRETILKDFLLGPDNLIIGTDNFLIKISFRILQKLTNFAITKIKSAMYAWWQIINYTMIIWWKNNNSALLILLLSREFSITKFFEILVYDNEEYFFKILRTQWTRFFYKSKISD